MGNLTQLFPEAASTNVLEEIVYYADGKTVSTSAGNFTAPNITAITAVTSNTFVENTGCTIAYTPPVGTTKVFYDATIMLRYYAPDGSMSPSWYVELDGTQISQTRRTELQQNTYEMVTHALAVVDINGTDSIATSQVASWSSNKTFKVYFSSYGTSGYRFYMNGVYHYNGAAANLVTPPCIKITAYS